MEAIFTIIAQDLEVAKKAVEMDKLEVLSYIGNRIMMNFFVTDEVKLMLLGYMVKELGGELRDIKLNKNNAYSEIKSESILYLNDLHEQVRERKIDPKIYWSKFTEMEERLRKIILPDFEASSYDEQGEYSKIFTVKLLDVLISKKQDIQIIQNMIPKYSFELGRNFNEHGGKESLVIYLVFKVLTDYDKYLINKTPSNLPRKGLRKGESRLSEYIDRIYNLKSAMSNLNKLYEESNLIIDDVGRENRMFYLTQEVSLKQQEQEILIPIDAKQKIDEIIMQSLPSGKI